MKYIPYKKRSKKARRAADLEKRGTWGSVNPITRIANNRKQYCRPKVKRETRLLAEAG